MHAYKLLDVSHFRIGKVQKRKLTRRRAHPVGMKARTAANKSDTVRLHTTNNTVMTDMKPRNRSPLRILNISWKSVPNLRLPIDTIFSNNANKKPTWDQHETIISWIMMLEKEWMFYIIQCGKLERWECRY